MNLKQDFQTKSYWFYWRKSGFHQILRQIIKLEFTGIVKLVRMLGDKSSKPALHFATCEFQNFLTAVFVAEKIKPFISTYGIFSKFFSQSTESKHVVKI